jgi:serine/threonine protein kinase
MSTTVRSDRHPALPQSDTLVPSEGRHPIPDAPAFPFLRPPLAPGEIGRLGGYRVFKLLGSGGMGKVFLAEDLALKRDVALKVMCPAPGEDLASWRERFLREARALAAIKHPNLVTVYQAGEDRGTVFLAMELLEGETLEARIRREAPLAVPEILRVAEEVARGLAAVHERGLIHRDIKPANIWLGEARNSGCGARNKEETEEGAPFNSALPAPHSALEGVKILDFGLVREVKGDTQLTEAGAVVGTPAYMSLEQVRGRPLDRRTDLFSLGVVLYAMCTGRTPFAADNPMAQAAALAVDEPVRVRKLNPAVPRWLSELIAELLGKEPEDRPDSAAEVIERLRGAHNWAASRQAPRRSPFRRHALKLVVLVWLAAAALLTVALTRGRRPADGNDAGSPAPVTAVDYLSDLPRADERVFPPPDAPRPPNVDGTVHVRGVRSPHGLFMHGSPSFRPPSFARYALGKKYSRFAAEVALNDTANTWAGLIFVVLADGKEVWQSRTLSAGDPPERCDLDVRGVTALTLEVRTTGPHTGAHGAWVEPRFTK